MHWTNEQTFIGMGAIIGSLQLFSLILTQPPCKQAQGELQSHAKMVTTQTTQFQWKTSNETG